MTENANILPNLDEEEGAVERLDPNAATLDAIIDALGGELSDEAQLKAYQYDEELEKFVWAKDYRASDLPLEPRLQKEHGGGEFEIRVYLPNYDENGRKISASQKYVRKLYVKKTPPPPEVTDAPPQPDLGEILERLQKQNLEMIGAMMEQQRLQMENLFLKGQQGKSNGMDAQDLLGLLKTFQDVTGGGNSRASADPFEQMTNLLTLQKQLKESVDQGSDDPLIFKTLDRITNLVEKGYASAPANYRENPAPPGVGQPGGAAAAGDDDQARPPAPDSTEEEQAMLVRRKVRQHLLTLCEKAANNRDPGVYAEVVLDEVPEQFYPNIAANLGDNDDEAVDNFGKLAPQVLEHRDWFKRLCACLRTGLGLDEQAEDLTPAAEGAINADTESQDSSKAPDAKSAAGAGDTSTTS